MQKVPIQTDLENPIKKWSVKPPKRSVKSYLLCEIMILLERTQNKVDLLHTLFYIVSCSMEGRINCICKSQRSNILEDRGKDYYSDAS